MNILILNWKDIKNPTAGGAERVTFEHGKRWARAGHSVTWLASSFKGAKKEQVIDGISVKRFGNIYGIYFYAPLFYLFSGKKFDVVVDEVHGIPFFTPLFVRKPKLVLIHEIAGEIWDYMYPFPVNYFGKYLERVYLLLYKNNKFWTDAEATIDELVENGIDRKNCISIPCPSDMKSLEKIPEKNSVPTFVWVSRVVRMKGIEEVLAAFKLVVDKYPNAKLNLIGEGEKNYVDYLKSEVSKNNLKDNVKFMGFVSESEKKKILMKSHMLLHASVKEGWGIVVIEAASQATPSIVYNVTGLSESVRNGHTGVVLENNNPEELAKEAIKLYENKTKYKLFQANCLKYAKSLNWETETNKSLLLLESLIENEKK